MRPREYLQLCGEIAGLPPRRIRERSEELLSLVGLSDVSRKISGFSRGMKQRLGIAQALLGEPRLLICDEPTSALDPVGRKQILEILASIKGKTTVLFSTHILSDVERICDRIAVLDGGRLVPLVPSERFRSSTALTALAFGSLALNRQRSLPASLSSAKQVLQWPRQGKA